MCFAFLLSIIMENILHIAVGINCHGPWPRFIKDKSKIATHVIEFAFSTTLF